MDAVVKTFPAKSSVRKPVDRPSREEAEALIIQARVKATEAVKLRLGIGTTLAGRLLVFDALKSKFRELKLRRDPACPTCGEGIDRSKIELIDYLQFCNVR